MERPVSFGFPPDKPVFIKMGSAHHLACEGESGAVYNSMGGVFLDGEFLTTP